jgi:hypothetical protein
MQAWGTIISAPDLSVIERQVESLDENALVVFDIDYTLIVPLDRVLASCGEKYWQQFIKKLRTLGEEGEQLGSVISLQSEVVLVNREALCLLDLLKSRKIKIVALSAMPAGRFGVISNAEQWRVDQLCALGIDFSWAFPEIDSLTLDGFDETKPLPVFKRGVIASSRYPKGKVLVAFLRNIDWKPSTVVFVDDRMEYIESVEQELEKEGIRHISIHYTEAIDQPCELDQQLADVQFNHLMQQGRWLSDEEAMRICSVR